MWNGPGHLCTIALITITSTHAVRDDCSGIIELKMEAIPKLDIGSLWHTETAVIWMKTP